MLEFYIFRQLKMLTVIIQREDLRFIIGFCYFAFDQSLIIICLLLHLSAN